MRAWSRSRLLAEVASALGRRALVYAGIRGEDVEPIADLPNLEASFCIIGAYKHRASVESLAYEDLTGVRVDLETWDIDDHLHADETVAFRRALLVSLDRDSALLPYRPSRFLSSLAFARHDRCLDLGMFGAHQSAFEHKPWVETSLAAAGVPCIPWQYIADEEQPGAASLFASGPVVLRRSRTSGGEGIVRVDDPDALSAHWPHVEEAFVSVAPFLDNSIAVNVGATVWADAVSVHHPSVQLIGIDGCTTREFGFCGNDFAAIKDLDPSHLDDIQRYTMTIGDWLRSFGYLGAFGVDYIIHDGHVLFTEVNPRFQGSTHASARLSIEIDEPCLMLEHLAARLHLAPPPPRRITDLVGDMPDLAHLAIHWTGGDPAHLDPRSLLDEFAKRRSHLASEVATRPDLLTDPEALVIRLTARERITESGGELTRPWHDAIAAWREGVPT